MKSSILKQQKKRRKNTEKYDMYVMLNIDGRQKNLLVSRLVGKSFISGYFENSEINHKDGNPINNHFSNLEWVTKSQNEKHAYATGLKSAKKGQENKLSKLKNDDVVEIKKRLKKGEKVVNISKDFNVKSNAIYKIKSGIRWGHIKI